MSGHIPTKEQEKSFKQVISALKKCKKLGLVFYAKQYDLIAYTKDADYYADDKCPLHRMEFLESFGTIPFLEGFSVLSDSGADDYAFYVSQEDVDAFNPERL